ncbi:MAG: hypothetical protein GY799_24175 [Desulfobulbaceae bacterium]|nr:hypothetical protein [Desulfobulbaceae bacterium]
MFNKYRDVYVVREIAPFRIDRLAIPWAAHVQLKDGTQEKYIHPIEQDDLYAKLMAQSPENLDQSDLTPHKGVLKEGIRRILKKRHHSIYDLRSKLSGFTCNCF